jgi:hypothetical protein
MGYLGALGAFVATDLAWLSAMTPRIYRPTLGNVLLSGVNLPPAVAFYVLYPVGILIFAIGPATKSGSVISAIVSGERREIGEPILPTCPCSPSFSQDNRERRFQPIYEYPFWIRGPRLRQPGEVLCSRNLTGPTSSSAINKAKLPPRILPDCSIKLSNVRALAQCRSETSERGSSDG